MEDEGFISEADITDAARTIAKSANSWIGTGQSGVLVFERDGSGGEFYTTGTMIRASGLIVLAVPQLWRDGYSPARIQQMLNEGAEK